MHIHRFNNPYNVRLCERKEIGDFIEKNHYSHSINGIKSNICFKLVDNNNNLVGAALFGGMATTAWKKFGESESHVLELRRLVLVDDAPRNTESWFLSKCIKYIKKNLKTELIVSYADPRFNHVGYIYQACNFIYIGESSQDNILVDIETGREYHSRALRTKYNGNYKPFVMRLRERLCDGKLIEKRIPGKHCYIYPMNKYTHEIWINRKKPYPKLNG